MLQDDFSDNRCSRARVCKQQPLMSFSKSVWEPNSCCSKLDKDACTCSTVVSPKLGVSPVRMSFRSSRMIL